VIDRHVGRALLVVSGWISPGYHDPSNEGVGIVDGGGRIVDEARLDNRHSSSKLLVRRPRGV